MSTIVDKVASIYFNTSAVDRVALRNWMRLQLPAAMEKGERDNALRRRIRQFPTSTESLEVAKALRHEGYYNTSTRLPDIARRVEVIRRTVRCG